MNKGVMSRLSTNNKGFTLVELMIVVAIIGILAAIAIPQFSAFRERAFNSAAQSDLRNARVAVEAYFADHMNYPIGLSTDADFFGLPAYSPVMSVQTSPNVFMAYISEGVVAASGREYIIISMNDRGTKIYIATSGYSGLLVRDAELTTTEKDAGQGTVNALALTANAGVSGIANWSSLGE